MIYPRKNTIIIVISLEKKSHLRSGKVEEFSQKIHDETHIRPHKMAALKEKLGSTGSPDRHMSPESTRYEANLNLIRPKNMAKLKNAPKYVPDNDTGVNSSSMYKIEDR